MILIDLSYFYKLTTRHDCKIIGMSGFGSSNHQGDRRRSIDGGKTRESKSVCERERERVRVCEREKRDRMRVYVRERESESM